MQRPIRLAIAALACVLTLAVALLGQGSYTAAVRGVVTDPSGAAVPAAKITVTDVTRGTTFRAQSDVQGRYVVTALPPSTYTLAAEAASFQTWQRSAFDLQVQQQATINVELRLGEVATVLKVEAEQPLLNTTIANLGQVVENKYILELPLISRSPLALAHLAPGVLYSAGRMGDSSAPFDVQTTNYVSNGARNSTSETTLDGVPITSVEINSGVLQLKYEPSVESVQEFKVQTNFFSAEYGQTGTTVVNMVTRSGTNAFHGTGFWFYRSSDLNANSFFANRAGLSKADFRRHQFGGVLGGPIKKDRLFFFTTYERTDSTSPSERTGTFPTLRQREGDFSDYLDNRGRLIQIFNPFDTYTDARGEVKRRPFAGNLVPKSMQDPVALNVTKYMPRPNQAGMPFTQQDNYFIRGVDSTIDNKSDSKVDWNISSKNRLTGRFSVGKGGFQPQNLLGAGNPAEPWNWGVVDNRAYSMLADLTRTHGPTTVLTFRFGYLRTNFDRNPFESFRPSQLGLPKYIDDKADFLHFPQFGAEGYSNIGAPNWGVMGRHDNGFTFSGSATKIVGGHNIKSGAEFRHFMLDYLQPGAPSSSYAFNRQITRQDRFAGDPLQGNGFASMLLGWGSGSNFHHKPWSYSRGRYAAFYVQDDWKATRKLTLNLGLRYDFDIPRWETKDRYSYWNLSKPAPIASKVPNYDVRGVYEFVGGGNPRSPVDGDYNNFGPRIGLAYALNDKTAIRVGSGLFFSLSKGSVRANVGSGFRSASSVEWSRDSNLTRYATLSNPWPDGLNLPPGKALGESTFLGLDAEPDMRENRNPEYYSWNLSVQRQLPGNSILEINYTANKGTHLPYGNDYSLKRLDRSYWPLGRTELNRMVPNPFFGVITDARSPLSPSTTQLNRLLRPLPQFSSAIRGDSTVPARGDSLYNALQLRYEKRFSRGLTMLTHYTWGKMLDDISHSGNDLNYMGGQTEVQDWYNLRNERAPSSHDVAHRFVLTSAYQLPVGKGRRLGAQWGRITNALLGGWELSGIWTYQTGAPLNVTQSGGVLWDAVQRPNLIGNPDPGMGLKEKFNRGQWFNPDGFSQPPIDVLGTAPRNLNYRSPHLHNLDAAIFKSFAVREGMRGEFRCEMDNATNVVTFGMPALGYGSPGFGRINSYAVGRGPRNIQLGLKFYF